jgi:hypothetical protein
MPEPMTDPTPPTAFRRPPAPPPLTSPLRPRGAATLPTASPVADTIGGVPVLGWAVGGAAALVAVAALGVSGLTGLFWMAAALLWLLSPLVGIWIWKSKGGHWFPGLLGGVFLGPLVLLMLLAQPTVIPCPQCGLRVPKVAKVCGHCRAELVPA